jgi:hypothetical protein
LGSAKKTPAETQNSPLSKAAEPASPRLLQARFSRQLEERQKNALALLIEHQRGVPRRALWPAVMRTARWKGARLKDVLDKVGLKKEAIEIASTARTGQWSTRRPTSSKVSRYGKQSKRRR